VISAMKRLDLENNRAGRISSFAGRTSQVHQDRLAPPCALGGPIAPARLKMSTRPCPRTCGAVPRRGKPLVRTAGPGTQVMVQGGRAVITGSAARWSACFSRARCMAVSVRFRAMPGADNRGGWNLEAGNLRPPLMNGIRLTLPTMRPPSSQTKPESGRRLSQLLWRPSPGSSNRVHCGASGRRRNGLRHPWWRRAHFDRSATAGRSAGC